MSLNPNDRDLDFLKSLTSEQLEPFAAIILGTASDGALNKKGRITVNWNIMDVFEKNFPDHAKYVSELIDEFQHFGGNTLCNVTRGYGVSYREILKDVCDKIGTKFDETINTVQNEHHLIRYAYGRMFDKLPVDYALSFISKMQSFCGLQSETIGALFDEADRCCKSQFYELLLIFIGVLSRSQHPVENSFSELVGVIFNEFVTNLIGKQWTCSITGEAYRVTVPATIVVSTMRRAYANDFSSVN